MTKSICMQIFLLSLYWNFLWLLVRFKHLKIKNLSSFFRYSREDLQSLHLLSWIFSAKLSTRHVSEITINLTLSINFILNVTFLFFLAFFLLALKGVDVLMYFFVFSPKYSNYPPNSPTNSFIIKW